MKLEKEFREQVAEALQGQRSNHGGADAAFAKSWGINPSVWSRIVNGETEGVMSDHRWLQIGRELGVDPSKSVWKLAKTEAFEAISNDIKFCKEHSKSMIFVDLPEIGKSFTAKYMSKTLKNCFYVDCSQAKTKQLLIRTIAKAVGVDSTGRYIDVKSNLKYYLKLLEKPIVILDEAGDPEYAVILELKELWNDGEGRVAWYMIGADGLQAKFERGIRNKKVGFRELFSRYGSKFMSIVPADATDKQLFYRKMITDVLSVNMIPGGDISRVVKKCLVQDAAGNLGGLRRAETILILGV